MRAKFVALIVPAIMIVVAVAHGWRVEQYEESPWIGAGFGMFAEIDGPQRVAVLESTDGEMVTGPALSTEELARTSNFPSDGAMRDFVDDHDDLAGLVILRPIFTDGDVTWEDVTSYDDAD